MFARQDENEDGAAVDFSHNRLVTPQSKAIVPVSDVCFNFRKFNDKSEYSATLMLSNC